MSCCCSFVGGDGGGGTGGGGGGSSTGQRFAYTVTGAEPDLANLVITLPAVRASATYLVFPAMGDVTNQLTMNVALASRATDQFVLSLGSDATVGDVFWFYVDDPT